MEVETQSQVSVQGEGEKIQPSLFILPRAIRELLKMRGLAESQWDSFFACRLKDLRHPLLLKNMAKATARLAQALIEQETVLVYGDYDLDGTSACALLSTALKEFGFKNVRAFQPDRVEDGYGLHSKHFQKFHGQGVSLVVSVDLGITNLKEALFAQELGIDLIITDHHLPQGELPRAFAVINPNTEECVSGLGHLAGTGVAFYLALALKLELEKQGRLPKNIQTKSWLDFFTLGTVADMVPLVFENRILVKHGLEVLRTTRRPGLQALLEELGLYGKKITAQDVAMRIAPKLNALSRMNSDISILSVYLEEDLELARRKVHAILEVNQMRQAEQKKSIQEALVQVEEQEMGSFILIHSEDFHAGVVGLVGSHLSKKFQRLAVVLAPKEGGRWVGSVRRPEDSAINAVEILEGCSDLLLKFGGHPAAAGLELHGSQLGLFRERLQKIFSALQGQSQALPPTQESLAYDLEVFENEIDTQLLLWLERLEPFGVGFPQPKFLLKDLTVVGHRVLKEKYLKYELMGPQQIWTALDFQVKKPMDEMPKNKDRVHVVGFPQLQTFRGKTSLQIMAEDFEIFDRVCFKE